jgi:hypothetical protein
MTTLTSAQRGHRTEPTAPSVVSAFTTQPQDDYTDHVFHVAIYPLLAASNRRMVR